MRPPPAGANGRGEGGEWELCVKGCGLAGSSVGVERQEGRREREQESERRGGGLESSEALLFFLRPSPPFLLLFARGKPASARCAVREAQGKVAWPLPCAQRPA